MNKDNHNTQNDAITRKPASKNIWYNLATIAGEPDRDDIELLELNRHYWHGLMRLILTDAECDEIKKLSSIEFPILTKQELNIVSDTLKHRGIDSSLGRLKFANSMKLTNLVFSYVNFSGFVFPKAVSFDNSIFNHKTIFSDAIFINKTSFQRVMFKFNAEFIKVIFFKNAIFRASTFKRSAKFRYTKFKGDTSFEQSVFNERIRFNNSHLISEIDFSRTRFNFYPPEFFNAKVPENIIWNGSIFPEVKIKRKKNHKSQMHKPFNKKDFSYRAVRLINIYERLALMMSKLEKHHDRHMFFRLEMRARRVAETNPFAKALNYIYDKLSDYGYGVGFAALAWAINIFGWIPLLFPWKGYKLNLSKSENWITGINLWVEAFGLSVSNTHSFLGLSKGPLKEIVENYPKDQLLVSFAYSFFGSVQTIFGAVLLFLLVLCARNRFRMS